MNSTNAYEELDLLTTKLLDEVATVEEVANLESLIKSDSQLKKRYVSLIMQESLLHWETGTVIEFSDEALYKSKNRSNVVPIISSVAAGIVAIFCAWALNLKFDGIPDLNESSISLSLSQKSKMIRPILNLFLLTPCPKCIPIIHRLKLSSLR